MKITSTLAILFALAALAALGLTFTNLLSGNLETRACQTECVQNYYFLAIGLSIVGALLAFISLVRTGFKTWPLLILVFCGFPFAVVAGIFTIGTLGTMSH